jgi:hypothetical protein
MYLSAIGQVTDGDSSAELPTVWVPEREPSVGVAVRHDELGQTAVPVTPTRPLAVDGDNVLGALAARRELGPDSDSAVVAAFLDQTGMAIDARVDQRVAEHLAAGGRSGTRTEDDRWRSSAIKLALGSFALAFPITGVVLSEGSGSGAPLVVLIWVAITVINLSFHRSHR